MLPKYTRRKYVWPVLRMTSSASIYRSCLLLSLAAPHYTLAAHPNQAMTTVRNPVAYIAPQCYTATQTKARPTPVNPCYTCHQRGLIPNFLDDSSFQQSYDFTTLAATNPWTNLFVDRTAAIALQTDQAILAYVRTSNYLNSDDVILIENAAIPPNHIILARVLANLPTAWDLDGDRRWDGFMPDAYFQFDNQGFDRTPAGDYTGWRALAYYPFPATYWPTNGTAADVLIRLAAPLRQDHNGKLDLKIYQLNLAIVEALMKRRDVAIPATAEGPLGVDIDKDGTLGTATVVRYAWAPREGSFMSYVGRGLQLLTTGQLHLAAGLLPEGTELLQSLRYLDINDAGSVIPAARMKELRYARKVSWYNYSELRGGVMRDNAERAEYEDGYKQVPGDYERGLFTQGWRYQGFIEAQNGELRPQTHEETLTCMGCHGGIGATADTTFSLTRKLDSGAWRQGWYHWSQKGLSGLNEPKILLEGASVHYEYSYYLQYAGSASELRHNAEADTLMFADDGTLRPEALKLLHQDIASLLLPSPKRALALNKAYRSIVLAQSYTAGRDVNLEPMAMVHKDITPGTLTGLTKVTNTAGIIGCYEHDSPCIPDQDSRAVTPAEATIIGAGMAGPNGQYYEVDRRGLIYKSQYQASVAGVQFTFPPRLTLPTRKIGPLQAIPSCYTCHRMAAPIVAAEDQAILPPDYSQVIPPTEVDIRLQRLTTAASSDTGAKWSPDGRTIAFVSDRSGEAQIWLMDSTGTNQQQLTLGPAQHAWPEWHPDSKRLAYWGHNRLTGQHSLEVIDSDGQNWVMLVESSEHLDRPTWHPNGDVLAYACYQDDNWDLWLVQADGSARRRLTFDPQMETNPLWSPDGKTLAYKVGPSGTYGLTVENFMTFANGWDKPTVHVWDGPQSVQMNAWSPDGKYIAYTTEVISAALGAEYVTYKNMISAMTIGAGKAKADNVIEISLGRTLGDRGAVFSPDGSKVAFWSWDQDLYASLWLYNIANAAGGHGGDPHISTGGGGGAPHISTIQQLTSGQYDSYPQWRPDGKALVFESQRGGNADLWLLHLP